MADDTSQAADFFEEKPEFTAAEIASAKRYLESGEYDGAETDPITYLRAQPPLGYPEQAAALGKIASRGDFVWQPSDDDMEEFERRLWEMLRPKTEAEAVRRRAERDRLDAETLRNILMRHHSGEVEGLTEDERRALATVAYRLGRHGAGVTKPICGYQAIVRVERIERTGTCNLPKGHAAHMPGFAEHRLWVNGVSTDAHLIAPPGGRAQ